MSDKIKARLGEDGYSYPYTHEDLVLDGNGISVGQKLKDLAEDIENLEVPPASGNAQSIINDNLVSNGKFLHSDVEQMYFFPWRFWGCAEVDKEEAIDSEGLLRIKFTKTESEMIANNQGTIGGGIQQEVHGLPRNKKVTLSFRHLHADNVHTTKADIIFRKKGGIEVHEINFSLNQENAVVHTEKFTFTTPDIDFEYATIGFFTDEGKVDPTDTNNVCSFGDVKLEVGTQVTEWVENENFADTGHSNLRFAFEYGVMIKSGWHSSYSKGIPGQEGYIKACTISIVGSHRDMPLIIEYLQRNTVSKKTLTIKFASSRGADPDLEFFRISGSSDKEDALLHKVDVGKWNLYIKKTEAYDEIIFWHCKALYDMYSLFVDWTPDQQVDAYSVPEGAIQAELANWIVAPGPDKGGWFNGGTPIIDTAGAMEIGQMIDFHHTNEYTGDYSARLSAVEGAIHISGHFRPAKNDNFTLGSQDLRWQWINLTNNPNVSSDRSLKENIQYIRNNEEVSYKDMYDFVKDELELATYNFKSDENKKQKMNFIAQDLLYNIDGADSKVGQMIINPIATPTEEEIENAKAKLEPDQEYIYPTLNYDMGMYISVLAGALKEALNKIEQLEAEIKELKDK